VIGNPVNRASKLEGANKALETRALTDRETLRRAGMQGYEPAVRAVRRRKIEGLPSAVEVVVLA
jgi:adenylate cyclase